MLRLKKFRMEILHNMVVDEYKIYREDVKKSRDGYAREEEK
jgi:hypothetical protein